MAKVTHPQESRQLRRGSLLQHVDHGGGAHHQGVRCAVESVEPYVLPSGNQTWQ
jgi:hypothetical protein